MDFFWFPDERFVVYLMFRYYDDYYYRDRGASGYYGREDPYYPRDPYARDRNWYYQPEYRNPYDR